MAPNPKVVKAFRAMKAIGILEDKVKPVLKRLLKLYDKNWELIEEENYRVLADAIFDDDDSKVSEEKENANGEIFEEAEVHDEPERPLKRLRLRGQEGQDSASPMVAGRKPKVEEEAVRSSQNHDRNMGKQSASPTSFGAHGSSNLSMERTLPSDSQSPRVRQSYKGKEPMVPQVTSKEKRPIVERPSHGVLIRDPVVDRGKQKMPESYALIKPKDEPFTDDLPCYESPIAVIRPDSSVRSISMGNPDDQEPHISHFGAEEDGSDGLPASENVKRTNSELAVAQNGSRDSLPASSNAKRTNSDLADGSPASLEIASSSLGEERLMNLTTTVDVLKKSAACGALNNGPVDMRSIAEVSTHRIARQLQIFSKDKHTSANGCAESDGGHELRDPESHNLAIVPQCQLTSAEIRSLHDINDISKGEELVEISWVNQINNECPSSFNYIPESLVFQNAQVKFTLSQIKADDCCSTCIGDCLSSTAPCVCSSESGGKFAYTQEGLIRDDFLDECISMTRDPQRQCLSYCKACPLERSKNEEILEPCKGHLKRKYIKECWSKCACHKLCGNRVVQRGLVCKLQVFFTPEGKGWGLRTLEKLPKGTFVCEYVGEILTNKELHERNMQRIRGSNNDHHTYPAILDAFWCSKGSLKDEEALCLDATFYGNAARFINHRCLDANLIEIPVKMETPDHHYYHLAFFTAREVNEMEELTWDYGIDFDDSDHPVEMFRCLCGSKFCRNMKRSNRSKLVSR